MTLQELRERVRDAIEDGFSLDWVNQNVIEPASCSTGIKGALFMEGFAALTPAEQQRLVRENYVMAREQISALN